MNKKSSRLRRLASRQADRLHQFYHRYARLRDTSGLILFHPDFPDRRAVILRIASRLGFTLTNNPRLQCDLAFLWKDATFREPTPELMRHAGRVPVLNMGCQDISKSRVDQAFTEAFGYSSLVDPTTYTGPCVRKSEINAQHDGEVVECPIAQPEPGFIYQKLLQRVEHGNLVVDYRVAVFGNRLAGFCRRYKELDNRFGRTIRQELVDIADFISAEEQANMLRFARSIGLDYGEIDMIRDERDQRLYLLDANNTPFWPPASFNISPEDREAILAEYQAAFRAAFLEPAVEVPEPFTQHAGVAGS